MGTHRKGRRMRKRRVVLLGILFGLVGAAVASVIVYRTIGPVYTSTGLIEVKPYIPRILYDTETSRPMPMYEQFVASQVELIGSPRVLDQAMAKLKEKQPGPNRSPSEAATELFREGLSVERHERSTLVAVTFTDEDPELADAAVGAVIDAYMAIFGERGIRERQERLKVLEDMRTADLNEVSSMSKRILDLAKEYGSDSLTGIYQFKLGEMQEVEEALRATELELALIFANMPLDPNDAEMGEGGSAGRRLGEKPDEGRAAEVAKVYKLRARQAVLKKLHETARQETLSLGQRNVAISGLKEERDTVREQLERVKQRIEELNVETGSGRIAVVSEGDAPDEPSNGARRAWLAAGGGTGGFAAVFAMTLVIGLRSGKPPVKGEDPAGTLAPEGASQPPTTP